MNDEIAIKVENVSKTFKLPHEKTTSIKSALINFRKHRTYEKQKVLSDISFEVKKGEFFGIVGRNGSGKSTLLKLIVGIFASDMGHIDINGSLTPFIELGVGFNPELTGRENVFLNGALLGFNRKEMNAMYQDIVDFAEIEKFMDQKLKNYSSGMQVRLAFSIAIRAKSEILLIDEVLAVGDTAFQRKCYEIFVQLRREGRTIVFVTHDMGAVERFCDKVLVLDKGNAVNVFTPSEATSYYDHLNANYSKDDSKPTRSVKRWGSKKVTVKNLQFYSGGKKLSRPVFEMGSDFELHIELDYKKPEKVIIGLAIEDSFGVNIAGPNSISEGPTDSKKVIYKIKKLPILPGEYKLTIVIFSPDLTEEYDHIDKGTVFQVAAGQHDLYGKVNLFGTWGYDDQT